VGLEDECLYHSVLLGCGRGSLSPQTSLLRPGVTHHSPLCCHFVSKKVASAAGCVGREELSGKVIFPVLGVGGGSPEPLPEDTGISAIKNRF